MSNLSFKSTYCIFAILIAYILFPIKNDAWIYPEHRDILVIAIQNLNAEDREILESLWDTARIGYESRLPSSLIDESKGFIDFPSWSAIAGDHSCSPENMLYNIVETEWILDVSEIAFDLKRELNVAENNYQIINAIRTADNKFQRVDLEYVTRAGSNIVHFLISLPSVGATSNEYAKACFTKGVAPNALWAYSYFHISALTKITYVQDADLSVEQKSQLILSALADEAFALHFLQDVYAAGHVAGTWGNDSQRKGTHDYYNENGLAVTTWDGKEVVLMGDAYMRPQDAELTAISVKMSLEQIIKAASGTVDQYLSEDRELTLEPNNTNICDMNEIQTEYNKEYFKYLKPILIKTPKPVLANGVGALPRFRTELGLFIGVAPSLRSQIYSSGFGNEQSVEGGMASIEAAIRFGIGLEGVLNESGDGLVFIDLGWKNDGSSSMRFGDKPRLEQGGALTAAIPARDAYTLRVRMPFWLIPGDLIFAFPIYLISPATYSNMAVIAGNGGLIPWQTGIATPIGRFQFILGREMGIAFYGLGGKSDAMLIPDQSEGTKLVQYQSTQFDIPILEYRPFRTFSMDQSSSLVFQLNFGMDIPHSEKLLIPSDLNIPELKTVYYLGLRVAFDWRYYF